MQTIEVRVKIGKSNTITRIVFLLKDFKIIEGNFLYLHNDERRFKISDEQVKQLIFQSELEINPQPNNLVKISDKVEELKREY